MTILTKRVIYCNECSYEEPNDYYFGTRDWIFATDNLKEELHFCSIECAQSFDDGRDTLTLINKLNNNDDELRKLLKGEIK